MEGFGATAMAVTMIAAFVLAIGGIRLARGRQDRRRGYLMIAAALVLAANVAIWTI